MATKSASGTSTLKNILLAAMLVVVSVAATLFLQDKVSLISANADTSQDARPVPIPDPLFTSLEPFTVSLRDDHGSRVVYVGITLRVEDEASRKMLNTYMPEVRDRVLATLTQQSTVEIQAPNGRERLSTQLRHALNQPYRPNPAGPRISKVLFTAFVVQ